MDGLAAIRLEAKHVYISSSTWSDLLFSPREVHACFSASQVLMQNHKGNYNKAK